MATTNPKGSINNPYTMSEFESMADAGTWDGGYVMDDSGKVTYMMKELIVNGYSCGSHSGSADFQFASYTSFSGDPSLNDDDDDDDDDGYGNGSGGSGSGGNGSGGNGSGGSGSGGSGNSGGGGNNNSGVTNPDNGGESYQHIIYSMEEALGLMDASLWVGGYVVGFGYVMPQITVLPTSSQNAPSGQDILNRALTFLGVPYKLGGVDMNGIDCSGLVSAALNIDRWTTGSGDIPTTTRVILNSNDNTFVNELQVGDILVWRKGGHGHCCIYAGDGIIFHAHGKQGSPTGYTSDLLSYWCIAYGLPKVYRR